MHTDIPEMPEDWWPDEIVVTGKSGGVELCFLLNTHETSVAYKIAHHMPACLEGLRKAIWQSIHS